MPTWGMHIQHLVTCIPTVELSGHPDAVAPASLLARIRGTVSTARLEVEDSSHAMAKVQTWPTLQLRLAMVALLALTVSATGLQNDYYQTSCPQAEQIVFDTLKQLGAQDLDLYKVLLRLHFHDCAVQGCEASVLLDEPDAEMYAAPNARLEGFIAIEAIKAAVEAKCPGVVSCADILAYAARYSVKLTKRAGADGWAVKGGRRDGRTSRKENAERKLPRSEMNVAQLVENFAQKGLTKSDMVVLSGAHTIGEAACKHIDNRIYYYPSKSGVDPNIPADFAKKLKKKCREPRSMKRKFDLDSTSDVFDSKYFDDLAAKRGLLVSDQVLWDDQSTRGLVQANRKQDAFFRNFAQAWVRMSEINVLTGSDGEIRRKCSHVNSN